MPIREEILRQPQNRFLSLPACTSLRDALRTLRKVDGAVWWLVTIALGEGRWAAKLFSELVEIAQREAALTKPLSSYFTTADEVEAVEQNSIGTGAAQEKARRSPKGLLIVLRQGEVIGILNERATWGEVSTANLLSNLDLGLLEDGEEVFFRVYYPPQARVDTRYSLLVYAHLQEALTLVERNVQHFAFEMGGDPKSRVAKQSARLKSGTPLTVEIECSQLTFEPPYLTRAWYAPWTRFEFTFRPDARLDGESLQGRVLVLVSGIEVAQIRFSVEVAQEPVGTQLGEAVITQSTGIYQSIFVSYSRRDSAVVEAYHAAQTALGNDVFMDTYSIRTGESWQAALANAIRQADVFQLFWSEYSSASDNVRDEWKYALKIRENGVAGFIRPVFWQKPLTPPPAELGHLNFRYVPFNLAIDALQQLVSQHSFWQQMETHLADFKAEQQIILTKIDQVYVRDLQYLIKQVDQITEVDQQQTLQQLNAIFITLQKSHIQNEAVQKTFAPFQEIIRSDFNLQHKFTLTLPLIPFLLDYMCEIGFVQTVDLNMLYENLYSAWKKLLSR